MAHDLNELLAAYALDALAPEEQRQLELHLQDWEKCQGILASYQGVTEVLLYAPGPKTPPRKLRARLLKQIDQRSETPQWRRTIQRVPGTAFGLALGLVVLLSANVGLLLQSQRLLDQGQDALAQQQAGQTAAAIASYPSSQVAVIEENGVRGTFVYNSDLPVGVMYVWGLQPPPEDQAYQAWLVDPQGKRLSAGLIAFGEDPGFGWLTIEAAMPIAEFSGLGVTLEPAGGSLAPTGPRILGTDL